MSSLIQATSLWGFREVLHHLGADANAYLDRFGIPRGIDEREDEFISFTAYVSMLETIAVELNCPDLGLRLASFRGLDVLGPVAVIARNSQTVGKGIEEVARYLYVHSPAMRLARTSDPDDPDVAYTFTLTDRGLPTVIQGYELSMAVVVRILHVLAGPDAAPASIHLPHPQQGFDEAYRDALRCPVRFDSAHCGFRLSAEIVARPIEGADPATRRLARRYLDARYVPPSSSVSERVADLARSLLPTGQCSIGAIAAEMALPPRTLQRRLTAESTSCQDVIDRERRRMATRYLADPAMSLSHVANLVGYTEQSALNRSCRRWFGMTPRQYRSTTAAVGPAR